MKEVERIRQKELKYQRDSGFWASGFMFTFGCAPTLVSDLISKIRFSNLFFSLTCNGIMLHHKLNENFAHIT